MKINNKLKTAAVLAVLVLNCPNSYAEDISSFESLQTLVQESSPATGEVSTDIQFLDSLTVEGAKSVTLNSAKPDGGHASFTPQAGSLENKRAFTVEENGILDLTDVDLNSFDVQNAEEGDDNAKNGGAVLNKGTLSVTGSKFDGNKAENGGAVYNDTNSNLTIKDGASFSNNQATKNGGAVYNKGNLTITSSEKGVEFNSNSAAEGGGDLYQEESGKTIIDGASGSVTFSGGIAGSGSITHTGAGDLKLNGDNSKYTGTFENSAGSVTVGSGSNFFGGTSTVKGGTLNWETSNEYEGTLQMTGGTLNVGSGSDNANLTIKGKSNIDGASSIVINTNSTLALEADTQITNSLSGNGNLTLSGAKLTFDNSNSTLSGLHFTSSNNSTVLVKNTSSLGDYINFVAGTNANNTALTLQLQDVSGEYASNLEINGTNIKELDFLKGENTNQYTASGNNKITVSGTGVMKNSGTTTITGDVENSNTTANGIDNSSDLTISGTLNNSGKLQNTGSLTVNTLDADTGSEINNANGTLKVTGATENSGNITGGTLSFNSLTNEGAGVIKDAISITVEKKVTNIGQISGGEMSFGSLNNSNSVTASGKLTVTGAVTNTGETSSLSGGTVELGSVTSNEGTIQSTTGDITVNNALTNDGTITSAKDLTVTGALTNNKNITATGTLSSDSITNTSGSIQAAIITATTGDIANNSGSLTATTGDITAAGNITNTGTSITAAAGNISAVNITNTSGTIEATAGAITATGSLENTGTITAGQALSAAKITNNTLGSITAASIEATSGDIVNNGDNITATTGDITATNITNSSGTIEATNGNVTAKGDIENEGGSVTANKKLSVTGSVTNTGSGTLTGGEAELGSITSNEGTIKSTTGGITINDGITSNAGSISSAGILSVTGGVTNTGSVTATGKLTVSDAVSNTGEGATLTGSEVELGSVTSNSGTIQSTTGGITVNGALTNAGNITSASDLTVKGVLTNDKNITVEGQLTATEGKLTNNEQGVIEMAGGSLAAVENNGSITNDGDLSISGTVTGSSSGTITQNGGELTLSGDASEFEGTFNLEGNGTLSVQDGGKLFGGTTNINNGSELDITSSGPIDFTGIVLKENGKFKYTSTGTNNSTIDNNVLSFSGKNAAATFAGKNETYTLAEGFSGDGNNLTFSGTRLKLAGTDYSGAGAITLDDTTLDLYDEEAKEYSFKKFTSQNGKVDLDVKIQKAADENKTAYLETDQLKFDSDSTGSLSIGKLYIENEENSENGFDITTAEDEDILQGGSVTFNPKTVGETIYKATKSFTYDVNVSDTTLSLTKTGVTGADTLKDMNTRDGLRQFSYKGTYKSNDDLGSTADGTFHVYGESKDGSDILSGIKEGSADEKVSFFDIGSDKTTTLLIEDLTIQDTQSSKGGSVARNESETSGVIVRKSTIQNNTSTAGKGGAFYNNGGKDIDFETAETVDGVGLEIRESTLKGNKASGLGGAIYNDTNGSMYLADVTVEAASGDALNDVYNAGKALVEGKNQFNSKFTNEGNIIFEGQNTIKDYVNNSGNTKFNGYTSLENVSGTSGSITNNKQLILSGDASDYKGTYTQTQEAGNQSITQVEEGAKFFGGTTTIEDGILNWFTNETSDYTLKVNNGIVNIGDDAGTTGTLNLTDGSSIADGVETNIYKGSVLGIMGDDVTVTLDENSLWDGNVNLTQGTLNINGITNAEVDAQGNVTDIVGSVTASGGNLNLQKGAVLAIDEKSTVEEAVAFSIDKNSAAGVFGGGKLTINGDDIGKTGDTWAGDLYIDKNATGELTIKDYTGTNGLLEANGGKLTITGKSDITLQSQGSGEELENSFIAKEVQTTIDSDAKVHVKDGGIITLDEATGDIWAGTVDLKKGGTFNYGMTDITGTLTADGGNLNLLEGSILKIKEPSIVEEAVAVDIQKGAIVEIEDGAEFTIDSETNDKWNGTIQILKDGTETTGGSLTTEGIDNTVSGYGGGLQQDTGSSTFDKKSNIHISDSSSYITGGEVNIKGESQLSFGAGVQDLSVDSLIMSNNTKLGIMNGEINYAKAEEVDVDGTANFSIDLDPRNHKGDQFEFGSIIGRGDDAKLNISDFNFQGGAPIDRYIYFELFTGDKKSVDFAATKDLKFTPIGWYGLQSMGEGMYRAYLDHYNPQVFRGQVATIGMYTNQLMVDDIVTNHFSLHAERMVDKAKLANKYSADNLLFAPYQHTYEDGGLWNKSYASFQKLDLTQNLNVGNNVYGTLLGADLPAVELKNNWKFIPTGYVGYNGAHQHFNGVSNYQNGGQLGVMGTFLKNDFVGSVSAYGGGYLNEMDVAGYNDETGNWFAGAAAKAAYNLKLSKTFTFQPNLFAAYNGFGKQNWHTDYGIMGMQSGLLNGANIAPGANFIFDKDTWSLYASIQYMFFINDRVNGRAGNVHLPNVRMNHGYIQYGFGGTKVFKDTFAAFGQFNILNAGITGIGLQAGLMYKLDTRIPFTNKKQNSTGEKKYIKK